MFKWDGHMCNHFPRSFGFLHRQSQIWNCYHISPPISSRLGSYLQYLTILASRQSLCEFCLLEKPAVGIGILFSYVDDITRVYKHPSTHLNRFNDLRTYLISSYKYITRTSSLGAYTLESIENNEFMCGRTFCPFEREFRNGYMQLFVGI